MNLCMRCLIHHMTQATHTTHVHIILLGVDEEGVTSDKKWVNFLINAKHSPLHTHKPITPVYAYTQLYNTNH